MACLANGDARNAKLAAVGRDSVEDLGQNQAVDNMAGDFDLFDDGIFGSHVLVFAGGPRCSRLFAMPWKPYTWVVFRNRQGHRIRLSLREWLLLAVREVYAQNPTIVRSKLWKSRN